MHNMAVCSQPPVFRLPAELRNGIHDGLFTAQNYEENWGIAHRVLVPAFGPIKISNMFDDMKDVRMFLGQSYDSMLTRL